ncbi:MAG: alkaline phosphatase [Saprospiraceae bacterium]|nr:alkaline phosphatase [Saprospiraceae bacterium]
MIGDGMGVAQITAGLYENNNRLEIERCTMTGLHKSHAADNLITDSAAGATAFSAGIKTNNGYLGLDPQGRKYESILRYAEMRGMSTGIIVTSTIVHATPAAFYAYNTNRNNYEEIASDILDSGFDFVIGGGKKYFERRTTDSINLIDDLRKKGYFVTDYFEQEYQSWIIPDSKKIFYFTADGDPLPVMSGRNYLPKASKDGVEFLQKLDNKGFFLMIEGSQIDWGGHANDSKYIISEMLDFDKAIKEIIDFAEKDQQTLVVITADHETGGYAINGGHLFGNLKTSFTTTHHTAELIPVFAYGPGAELFSGIYENTEIYHKLKKLLQEEKK